MVAGVTSVTIVAEPDWALPAVDCAFPAADCAPLAADCAPPGAECAFPDADCALCAADCALCAADCALSAVDCAFPDADWALWAIHRNGWIEMPSRHVEDVMTSCDEPLADLPEVVTRGSTLSVTGLSRAEFDSTFRRLRGDGYIARTTLMSARQRIVAVVEQAHGDIVVAGMAALIMHGSAWYDEDFTIELIRGTTCSGRPARGTVTHRLDLKPEDVIVIDGIKVTSAIRTAFDIGRMRSASRALGYLDALARATGFDVSELQRYVAKQKGRRNVVQLRRLIPLIDARIESPAEAWLFLTIVEGGLPSPDVQIEVRTESGHVYARIDLGYEALKIGIEYDGEYHTRPGQQVRDAARRSRLHDDEWTMIYVVKDRLRLEPFGVLAEIRQALHRRGAYFD